jgi:hypothetical protein
LAVSPILSRRFAMTRQRLGWGTALAVLVVAFVVFGMRERTAAEQANAPAAAGPKYTIVDTEGTNLLVVDNSTNTLYFYTVDPGKQVGDDLHLRGSVDLSSVGKAVIKPKKTEAK